MCSQLCRSAKRQLPESYHVRTQREAGLQVTTIAVMMRNLTTSEGCNSLPSQSNSNYSTRFQQAPHKSRPSFDTQV